MSPSKTCNYGTEHANPNLRTSTNGLMGQDRTTPATELDMHRTLNFPCSYFLDSDLFQPISRDILTIHDGPFFIEQQRRFAAAGQAVRLATMVGLHSQKDAKQLFVEPETWTLCEEQRRTWWAIVMLDRVVVAGSPQLLMAAPDPNTNDLLPCNDDDWTNGRIGFNEALFTRNFHSPSSVGQFARVCQAVHMFGKVLRHIKSREKDTDPVELTAEALQLHIVLTALDQGIKSNDCHIMATHGSFHSALSLCSLARLLLYNEYACNEPSFSTARERLAAEVEMQQISLASIQDIVSKTIPQMARQIVSASQQQSKGPRHSPILAGCLYHAATECVWFVKENNDAEMVAGLEAITHALEALKSEWTVCNEYLTYLQGNSPQN
ncbi:hypothetical protein FOC1_g10001972 [Fusarium oxysporum f. sp. cubense race 1]|uniref:Xylanolytic transcriptional activator regulatory domain-containing protein n=1 Tax=Fusarium oxysporum f. sp. cubense (strain race 1) TaxID=1229664 RepID=N4UX23_FUSC1|nr:hypothetical protein FOC1_g10001972 [Fusarium oxysporum f. sp. cubense race 1]